MLRRQVAASSRFNRTLATLAATTRVMPRVANSCRSRSRAVRPACSIAFCRPSLSPRSTDHLMRVLPTSTSSILTGHPSSIRSYADVSGHKARYSFGRLDQQGSIDVDATCIAPGRFLHRRNTHGPAAQGIGMLPLVPERLQTLVLKHNEPPDQALYQACHDLIA